MPGRSRACSSSWSKLVGDSSRTPAIHWLLLAEGQLRRRLFDQMLQRIYALSVAERLALRFAVAKSGTEGEGLSSV